MDGNIANVRTKTRNKIRLYEKKFTNNTEI